MPAFAADLFGHKRVLLWSAVLTGPSPGGLPLNIACGAKGGQGGRGEPGAARARRRSGAAPSIPQSRAPDPDQRRARRPPPPATDPDEHGYGLGAGGFAASLLIGTFLVAMAAGAVLFPRLAQRVSPRLAGGVRRIDISVPARTPSLWQVLVNISVAGVGSGALIAALPAAAAAAAPAHQTGMATGLTNTMKTLGGAFASVLFGSALLQSSTGFGGTAGSFAGYQTVWIGCGAAAAISAITLRFVPKDAFTDQPRAAPVRSS
ncbi:MAG: hypothetical protein QM804_05930 [Propionicimonas sp.]